MNIKALLGDTVRVKFDHFKDGCLWYSTQNGFQFPIEASEIPSGKALPANGMAKIFEFYIRREYYKHNRI